MKPETLKSKIFLTLAAGILSIWVVVWFSVLGFGLWGAIHSQRSDQEDRIAHYGSEELNVQFSYPNGYAFTLRHDSFQGTQIHVITMVDTMVVVPDMSDGPISMSLIELPITPTSTFEAWVRDSSISNFYLSPDKTFTRTTVGGEPALAYTYSGLYESDAVAVQHAGKIYLFAASWMSSDDPIRTDFKNLLASVKFIE